jgi:hypothetical protein
VLNQDALMKMSRPVSGLILASILAIGTVARAAPAASHPTSGKAAAHAALSDAAVLPAQPPALPTQASETARNALSGTAFGQKGAASSAADAEEQAARHAHDALLDAHADAASHAAQGSVAAAARTANTDVRAAANQAQSNSAKANAAGHKGTTTHP